MDEQTLLLIALALLAAAGIVVGVAGIALFRRWKPAGAADPAEADAGEEP